LKRLEQLESQAKKDSTHIEDLYIEIESSSSTSAESKRKANDYLKELETKRDLLHKVSMDSQQTRNEIESLKR
jgi:SUMO ligase MMS21 Smc5/6 complex component